MAYRATGDKILFFAASMLTAFGLLMVYSASSALASSQHGTPHYYFMRQALYAAAGMILMMVLMNIDYHFWRRRKVLKGLLILCLACLLLVFLQPKVNGAHRWLRLGSLLSFQPSEFAKLAVILYLASYLHDRGEEINRFCRGLLPCLLVVGLFGALIAVEPDLGQAICLGLIAGGMLFIAGLSWKYICLGAFAAAPLLYFAVFLVPFRRERMLAFLNPLQDYLGAGWQISQSLTAVGSGGLFGLGLGESRMKLFFLPEAHSDFIFAVIGEEFGLLGTGLVCVGFLVVFYRGMRACLRAPDSFGFYTALGITLMVALQAFINISMVLALVPTKGIALPFISQGGTSLLLNLVAIGILLNISHQAEKP